MIHEIAPGQTILIVDDDENNLQLIAKAVHSAGFKIIMARDGPSAIDICNTLIPDAILLDIMMPGISGIEVCKRMREMPSLSEIPIIFLSAAGEDEIIEQGLINGGSDYVSKPFSKRVLLARLHSHIERSILQKTLRKKNLELDLRNQLLIESEAYLKSIIWGSPFPQFVLNRNHAIIHWNKGMEEITGIKADEVIGSERQNSFFYKDKRPCLSDLVLDGDIEKIKKYYECKLIQTAFNEGRYEVIDFFPDKLISGTWFFFTASPVLDRSGTIIGAVETIVDLTEQKLNEEALKQIIKKLHLLSGITRHDILNKVTALIGYLSLIKEQLPHNESPEYIDRAENIVEIITSLITFTRDYQEIGINSPNWQNLEEIIKKNVKSLDMRKVIIETDTDNIEIYGDPLLVRVFYNLFDNSLRHGNNLTFIRISMNYPDDTLEIIYEDDGGGVPESEKDNIFYRRFYKNSGFGLFLSKEILQITGLSIQERGKFGDGVMFKISVPKGHFRKMSSKNGYK
jgi:PAS domain S-box-containing protein